MTTWTIWLALAGVLVLFELFTGTFYVLMVAIGLAFGAVAALAGLNLPGQITTAAVIGLLATGLLHRSRFGKPQKRDISTDPNVHPDIGQAVPVGHWVDGRARVMYRGALWDVQLAPGAASEAGSYTIVEVQGSRLILANAAQPH